MRALLVFVLLAVLFVGCTGPDSAAPTNDGSSDPRDGSTSAESTSPGSDLTTIEIENSSGDRVEVRAEIADDLFEQARGLMYRTALAEDRGMLFVYDDEQERSFYMKNTVIPLSIAFMDSRGRIVDIQDMKPLDGDPPHYVSAEPAQYALEVNQGFFEGNGVEVGDRAELPV